MLADGQALDCGALANRSPQREKYKTLAALACLAALLLPTTNIAQAQDYGTVFFIQGEPGPDGERGESRLDCTVEGCRLAMNLDVEGPLDVTGAEASLSCGDVEVEGEANVEDLVVMYLGISESVWMPECPPGYERAREGVPEHVTLCRRGRDEMVKVGDIWVDRYEASVWEAEDCSGTQYGVVDNWPRGRDVDFPYHGQFRVPFFACSVSDVLPSRFLTWFQAQAVCAASGKHLITNAEWQAAVIGTLDPDVSDGTGGTCSTSRVAGVRRTGLGEACRSYWGIEDMIGNAREWAGDWYGQGGDEDGGVQPVDYFQDLYWNVDAAEFQGEFATHFPSAGQRGGSHGESTRAGAFCLILYSAPSNRGPNVGFRCARGY